MVGCTPHRCASLGAGPTPGLVSADRRRAASGYGARMAFKEEQCQAWVAEHAPGEHLVSHLVTQTWAPQNTHAAGMNTNMRFSGAEIVNDKAAELGLAEENKVGQFQEKTFLALTQGRILYGSRNWRDRPKKLLHAAPASDFAIHWVDEDYGAGTLLRHLLLDFGGGAWRTDRVGLRAMKQDVATKHNVEPFFAALGERAHQIA